MSPAPPDLHPGQRSLVVEIWSDIACPWCYVGKRRLEAALRRFAGRDAVQVIWRAFELDPAAPRVRGDDQTYAERLAAKYRCSLSQAEAMIEHMTATAAAEGLDFRFDVIRPGNTFDAHRLLHLARGRSLGSALKERLLRAYLTEGAAIGDPETLARLAGEVGLGDDEVRATLAGDAHGAAVRDDEAAAAARGIQGVPFFAIGRHRLSGAQPPEALLAALEAAWQELPPAAGPACGPAGCG